jgi:pimeloyl-ACP methyl ester carboxylesterase
VITTLAFFHGWGASGLIWEQQAAAFGRRLTVLTPTVPVWEVGWFADFLRDLPLQETLLVGWSLGGMLLLEAVSWSWWGWPRSLPGGRIIPGGSHPR